MDEQSVVTAYKRMANHYDRVFGAVFEPGRQLAVSKMNCRPGDRILEVGVGTGLSLVHYPEDVQVTGIDVSPHMLDKARSRLNGDAHRISLELMDAQDLDYADNSFDKVVAMYVASVVPDPAAMMREMKRVCRPGGDLFVINHFSGDKGAIAACERMVSPISRLVGFRTSFPMGDFLKTAELDEVDIEPVNMFGYWKLLHARNV